MHQQARIDNLKNMLSANRIIRGTWHAADPFGRECMCLLAALAPEAAEKKSCLVVPETVMPQWLAQLTVWMNDLGTTEAWPLMIKRYVELAEQWHTLKPIAWKRAEVRVRRAVIVNVQQFAEREVTRKLCEHGVTLFDRVLAREYPLHREWHSFLLATHKLPTPDGLVAEAIREAATNGDLRVGKAVRLWFCIAMYSEYKPIRVVPEARANLNSRRLLWDYLADIVLDSIETELEATQAQA